MTATVATSPVSPVRKTFDCDVCGSKYSRAEYLRRHARKHENVHPFKCPYPNCTKEFARSDVLLRHRRRQHPGDMSVVTQPGIKRGSDSPPPLSPTSPTGRGRGRRRSSAASTYSSWGEHHVKFEPYEDPRRGDIDIINDDGQSEGDDAVPLKPPALSIETEPHGLHANHLPIVPPFQLSSSYSPTSPIYAHGPGSPAGLSDAFRSMLVHNTAYANSPLLAGPYLGHMEHSWSPVSLGSGSPEEPSPYGGTPMSDNEHGLQFPMLATPENEFFPFPSPPDLPPHSPGGHTHGQLHLPNGTFPFVDLQRLLRERGEYQTVGGP